MWNFVLYIANFFDIYTYLLTDTFAVGGGLTIFFLIGYYKRSAGLFLI